MSAERFRKGDNFLAQGYVRDYTHVVDGHEVTDQQFVTNRLAHDPNTTTYQVDRRPRSEREGPAAERDQAGRNGNTRTTPASAATAAEPNGIGDRRSGSWPARHLGSWSWTCGVSAPLPSMRRSPPIKSPSLPTASGTRARRSLMNRYATMARQHWERYAPSRVAALPDPTRFFSELGTEVEGQVSDLTERLAMMTAGDCSAESYLETVARLQTARRTAEEVVMAELVWIKDPELSLPEAREEWEQTRPADEDLISWAERIQGYPDSMPSTDELEEMAQTWALSVEFLQELVATEPPRDYMQTNQPALSEAANIRFWRELRRPQSQS